MKTYIYIFSIISFILLLSSCKKEIVSKDIYGVWEMQVQTTAEGPQFVKLLLEKDGYSWIDPVVSDTIYYYEKVDVSGDTLLLTDGFKHPTLCIIEELHDRGPLVSLDHIIGPKVFQDGDGLVDAFRLDAFAQAFPFAGEFAAAFEDRQEVFRKGITAAARDGTDHPVERDRHDAEGKPAERGKGGHPFLQDGQVRVAVGLDGLLVYTKAFTAGLAVMIQ